MKCPRCGVELRRVEPGEPFYVELPPGLGLYQCPQCLNLYICNERTGKCHEYSEELYRAIVEEWERRRSGSGEAGSGRARAEQAFSFTSLVEAWGRYERLILERLRGEEHRHGCGGVMVPVRVAALSLLARRAIVMFVCKKCGAVEMRMYTFDELGL